jgi:hypothetical protein
MVPIGCGSDDGLPRQPVSGAVTLDGQPLECGMITFIPAAPGDAGIGGLDKVVTAEVVDGRYSLTRADGPVPGPHRVEIHARKSTGRKVKDPDDPQKIVDERREAVPSRYNARSELAAEIREGGNALDFTLQGVKVASRASRR